jgi:type 1 glutamine amidotransferase
MKFSLLLTLPLFTLTTAWSQKVAAPDQVEKVKAALPATPAAKPKAKHEVLVFSKTNGFRHSSIELGVEAMKLLGEKTGVFNVTATEDESVFEPDSLKKFAAVIFLNTTGELFRPKDFKGSGEEKKAMTEREERLKKALLEFVNNGKGVIGFHSATDTFSDWKDYHDMMGGVFGGHPWHEKIGVQNVDPSNPINKAFNQTNFDITDEIYQWKPGSFSTDNHRVLLAIDKAKTNMEKGGTNGKDALYPISVMRKYGKGRCFYCSLGHREEIYWNTTILQHYLAGIQFALGDLEAEAAPKNVP